MNAIKSRRYTAKEKSELVENYQTSGMTQTAWCKAHEVSAKSLHQWLNNMPNNKEDLQSWAPVIVAPEKAAESNNSLTLQIGKCSIEVTVKTDKVLLADVLETLVRIC